MKRLLQSPGVLQITLVGEQTCSMALNVSQNVECQQSGAAQTVVLSLLKAVETT